MICPHDAIQPTRICLLSRVSRLFEGAERDSYRDFVSGISYIKGRHGFSAVSPPEHFRAQYFP